MSISVMTKVWELYPGNGGSELLALLALADWCDDDARCFPSMSKIAAKTRLSRSQAQRVVHGLIADGYLSVTENLNGGKPGSSRRYRIVVSKMTGRTHATGSAHATGRTHAQDGSHPCAERGRTHATLTINEPSLTTREQPKRVQARDFLPDIADSLFADFAKLRSTKKAPITKTAVDGLRREAAKAGMTIEQVITVCCERGWSSFKAAWITEQFGRHAATTATPAWDGAR